MTVPALTSSAVGFVRVVAAALMSSLTRAPTVTDAVFVVLQLPALPLHCALTWVAPRAVPSTIAARIERVAFIVVYLQKVDGAGSQPELKPVLSKAVVGSVYKTKTDPSSNPDSWK